MKITKSTNRKDECIFCGCKKSKIHKSFVNDIYHVYEYYPAYKEDELVFMICRMCAQGLSSQIHVTLYGRKLYE